MIWISFAFVPLNHLVNWISEGRMRAGHVLPRTATADPISRSSCSGVLRLETLDDIDNTGLSHKFSDGGADSLRLAWHHRDFFSDVSCLHRYSFRCCDFKKCTGVAALV